MFATIDDLDGSVEVMVFEKALAAAEGVMALDEIVLVRGRVDHKEAGKVCVIVQDAERFDPTDAEIEKARRHAEREAAAALPRELRWRVDAGRLRATVLEDLRDLFGRYRGDTEFVLEMHTRAGLRCLRFGEGYRVASRDAGFRTELRSLLGPALQPETEPEPEPEAAAAAA
jgi:DNA polymerase-3 subunit alpha